MKWELLPVSSGGLQVSDRYTLACLDSKHPICAVEFFNQGSNSVAKISYGGITRVLLPGASWTAAAPNPIGNILPHDITEYKVEFTSAGGAAAQVNKLVISQQKYTNIEL